MEQLLQPKGGSSDIAGNNDTTDGGSRIGWGVNAVAPTTAAGDGRYDRSGKTLTVKLLWSI